jgi:hypothetical protein
MVFLFTINSDRYQYNLLHGYITIAGITKQSAGGLIPKSQPESIHMSHQFLTEVLENLLYYFHDITLLFILIGGLFLSVSAI